MGAAELEDDTEMKDQDVYIVKESGKMFVRDFE